MDRRVADDLVVAVWVASLVRSKTNLAIDISHRIALGNRNWYVSPVAMDSTEGLGYRVSVGPFEFKIKNDYTR